MKKNFLGNSTILVTGSKGQLGSELQALHQQYKKYNWLFTDKEELDIMDEESVQHFFHQHKIDWVINTAAYTAVDKAETEKELAYLVNADAVKFLAKASHQHHAKFIQVSTDYVFDGNKNIPYVETDKPNPTSVYGASKLLGEQYAIQENPNSIIIRTSWVYSEYGKNFVKTMIRLMQEKGKISVVNDQYGSPTYASDLAKAIVYVIDYCEKNQQVYSGIYHYTNRGIINWYDFAVAIKEITKSNCSIESISTAQYPTPAKRPTYSALDTSKICHIFTLEVPNWKESLRKCIQKLHFNL